jgi:cell division protein FtsW (lipid II flippase)
MSNLTSLVIGLAGVAIILKVPVKTLDKRVSVPVVMLGWALVLIAVIVKAKT